MPPQSPTPPAEMKDNEEKRFTRNDYSENSRGKNLRNEKQFKFQLAAIIARQQNK